MSSCPPPKACKYTQSGEPIYNDGDKTTCQAVFKDKPCTCIQMPSDACNPNRTVCGYKEGGVLYECNTGCCKGACPGACVSEFSIPPQPIGNTSDDIIKYIKAVVILLITLVLLSTVSLLA